MLGPLRLRPHDDARRLVLELDRGVGLVPVLATSSRSTAGGLLDVPRVEAYLNRGGYRKNRHGDCGGLNPAPLLGRRHPLPAMPARLVGEDLLGALALDSEYEEARAVI